MSILQSPQEQMKIDRETQVKIIKGFLKKYYIDGNDDEYKKRYKAKTKEDVKMKCLGIKQSGVT